MLLVEAVEMVVATVAATIITEEINEGKKQHTAVDSNHCKVKRYYVTLRNIILLP